MKKFNFKVVLTFDGECTVKAENEEEAREIAENYLYAINAELNKDACADKAKQIIDFSNDLHGDVEIL